MLRKYSLWKSKDTDIINNKNLGKTGKYNIIYADPPWKYHTYSKTENNKGLAENFYETMSVEEIKSLPISNLAEDNCALFLWATAPCLPEAFEVIKSWGFEYKTVAFVWIKQTRKGDGLFWGMGHYTRANAEFCLLAMKGHLKRLSANVHSIISSRKEEHSKKPDITRTKILELFGDLPRIELFARQKYPGWDSWGNEISSDVELK